MNTDQERRRMERFLLSLPALVVVRNNGKHGQSLSLCTENVCAGGAYFPCPNPLPLNTRVDVGMLIPIKSEAKNAPCTAHIQVTGQVVRQEKRGMAIRFDNNYRLNSFLE